MVTKSNNTLFQFYMKRFVFILILATLVSFVAKAESVSRSEAFNTAQHYLLSKGKILSQNRTPYRSPRRINGQEQSAYYYVFNAEGDNGYVIVSGDDRTPEILGYVDNGSFDEETIPDNMKSWLQLYVDQIKYLDDNNITVDKRAIKARALAQATRHSIPMMITSRWNQGHPYNITCPKYYKEDGTQAYPATGCTATAMAQVINFYKYPEKIKAAIPSISNSYTLKDGTKKTVTTKIIPKNTPIDWDNICDRYSWEDGHVANAQDTAVANLMYYCGQAVKMGYGPSSGANFSASAFINYFGFDDGAYVVERSSCTIDEWFNMIYAELSAGFPVLFSGFSSGGGHAFVLDGFDGEQLFHVNWGWGGGSDGWFLVSILNSGDNSGIGATSSSDGYSMSQRAMFNLRLPDNVRVEKSTSMTIHDIAVSGTTISGHFINWTGATNSFNTGIVKLNEDNSLSLVGSSQTITDMSKDTYQNKTFNIKGRLQPGTYRLSPASKLTTNRIWRPELDLKRNYILAEVDSSKNITLSIVKPIENICVDTIIFKGTRAVNEEQEIVVTFRNNGDEYSHEVRLFVGLSDDTKTYSESRSLVSIRKGETVDISFFYKPEETGTYKLWLCRNSDGSGVIGEGTMEVVTAAQAQKANLAVTGFTIQNSANGVVYGNRLVGTITVKNSGKETYNNRIKLQLWHQPKGSSTAWSSTTRTVEVNVAPARSASASFQYDNLTYGDTYHIKVSYGNQDGTLSSGGIWDHSWVPTAGIISWKNNGTVVAQASKAVYTTPSTAIATYANNISISRMNVNKNPNTIYYFAEGTKLPIGTVTEANLVSGSHADSINLYSGYPFYIPESFEADTVNFHYTFPTDEESEVSWEAITFPFDVDSIRRGDFTYELNDSLGHFWIYEFAESDDDGNPVFLPATELRANTAYIIACDSLFNGRTITFTGANKQFFKTGSDKMIVSSDTYSLYGTTYQPAQKNVYMLNESGTAFEYVSTSKAISAIGAYFTTKLADEERLEQIPLPELPQSLNKSPWGDVTQDQVIDDSDIEALARTLVLKTPEGIGLEYGDLNGDGKITIVDLVLLINKIIN